MTSVTFRHVDVFATGPYTGNSVAVVPDPPPLTTAQMATITRELRHFETVFVTPTGPGSARARVFDLDGELAFAGHPLLGAAAVLHDLDETDPTAVRTTTFSLAARSVTVTTTGTLTAGVRSVLDQGRPDLVGSPPASARPEIATALGLGVDDLDPDLPPEVLSTGLRYLVLPVRPEALPRAGIARADFAALLDQHGAEFAYLLDATNVEGRHWNNDGILEDVATGSAAGCVAAYLMRHHRAVDGEEIALQQGRFVGRPSQIKITAYGGAGRVDRVVVAGTVFELATGELRALPRP